MIKTPTRKIVIDIFDYLLIMKLKTILHILGFFVVSVALLLLTQSWWMALGILMVILLIDNFLKQYDNKRKREWMQKHLNDMDVEEEQEKEENN